MPSGKGIPRTRPSGTRTATDAAMRASSDQPVRPGNTAVIAAAVTPTIAAIASARAPSVRGRIGPRRPESMEPSPAEARSDERTTEVAYVGCPRKRMSFCIRTISSAMNPAPSAAK